MAQQAPPSPQQQQQQQQPIKSSKTARAASALKSGVVYGGSALLNGVNAITPHFSGAVDIMVVEQPDGSYKSTPFYVRFGKYTHLRSKDRRVHITVNGVPAPFHMHLGEYGQAYFASEAPEPSQGDDEEQAQMLAGMMSPASGYSSGDEDRPGYANAEVLASVQEEVRRLRAQETAGGDPAGSELDKQGSLGPAAAALPRPPAQMVAPAGGASPPTGASPSGSVGYSSAAASPMMPSFASPLAPAGTGQGSWRASGRAASSVLPSLANGGHGSGVQGAGADGSPMRGVPVASPPGMSRLEGLLKAGTTGRRNGGTAGDEPAGAAAGNVGLGGGGGSLLLTGSSAGSTGTLCTLQVVGFPENPPSPTSGAPSLERPLHLAPPAGVPQRASASAPAQAAREGQSDGAASLQESAAAVAQHLNGAAQQQRQLGKEQGEQGGGVPASSVQHEGRLRAHGDADLGGGLAAEGSMQHAQHGAAEGLLSRSLRQCGDALTMAAVVSSARAADGDGRAADLGAVAEPFAAILSHATTGTSASQNLPSDLVRNVAIAAAAAAPATRAAVPPDASSFPDSLVNSVTAVEGGTAIPSGGGGDPRPSASSAAAAGAAPAPGQGGAALQGPVAAGVAEELQQQQRRRHTDVAEQRLPSPERLEDLQDRMAVTAVLSAVARGGTAAAAAAPLAVPGEGSGQQQQQHVGAVTGFELSLCGQLLQPDMSYQDVAILFDTHRVDPADWAEKGSDLVFSPHLMVRLQGEIYPWNAAAALVLGWACYGAWWPHLVPADAQRWAPPTGAAPQLSGPAGTAPLPLLTHMVGAVEDSKKAPASGPWRLWPFSSTRVSNKGAYPCGSSPVPGGGPNPPTPGAPSLAAASGLPALMGSSPTLGSAALASMALLASGMKSNSLPAATAHSTLADSTSALASVGAVASVGSVGSGAQRAALGKLASGNDRASGKLVRSKSAHQRKTLSPSWGQLNQLRLRAGQNTIKYSAGGTELVAYVYFFHWATRLVISDIDGTITKSDVLGHLLPAMGWDWSHAGISRLFTDIARNRYQLMYLSSRSISQAGITRDYLNTLVQGNHRMPVGPVIISPHGLIPSLYREMILRRPHEFKIATLQDIRALFPPDWNPFYAGFGNRDTDEMSYRTVGVPLGRIFIINPKGELRKAAVTMQSSSLSSLAAINNLIDDIFPPAILMPPASAEPDPPLPPLPPASPGTSGGGATFGAQAEVEVNGSEGEDRGGDGQGEECSSPGAAAAAARVVRDASHDGCLDAGTLPGRQVGAARVGGDAWGRSGASAGVAGLPLPSPNPMADPSQYPGAVTATAPLAAGGKDEARSREAQNVLLYALQAAEQYNDIAFWGNDPSALMAGDMDELERLLASRSPQPSRGRSGGGGGSTQNCAAARRGVGGWHEVDRAGEAAGGGGARMEGGGGGLPRHSRDFVASYRQDAL